jgi:glycosyltransferase involved in cell wall biosynthesis
MPKVSVIIPNYNHAQYLRQRIDSILHQTYSDFELIILDDCSTDNSKDIIESYRGNPKVSCIVYNEKNGGTPFKQWNKGIGLASGEWVWIAESDDHAEPEFLEKLMEQAMLYTNVGLLYCTNYWVDENGTKVLPTAEDKAINVYSGKDYVLNKMLYENEIPNVSSTLFRRNMYSLIDSALYENMKLCGDWFFYILLSEQADVLALNKAYSNYRLHDLNSSSKAEIAGASCLEGVEILDYVVQKNSLKSSMYSLRYARRWLKLKVTYTYSKEVNDSIKKRFLKNHKLVVFYYYVLLIYRMFK